MYLSSPSDDDVTTNAANLETENNNMIEEAFSEELDLLEVEYEPVELEESDNKQTKIDDCDTPSTSK